MEFVLLRRLVDEMDALLSGTRIEQAYALPRYHLACVPGRRREPRLWFAAEPDDPHIYLRPGSHPTPTRPPAFAMAVRKYARGRRVAGLAMLGSDRVVELRWHGAQARLVIELVPRRATAYLLGDDESVVAVWNPRRGRPGVGARYTPPDRGRRPPIDELGDADWRSLESATLAGDGVRALLRRVGGMSTMLAREAVARFSAGEPLRVAATAELDRAEAAPTAPAIYAPGQLASLAAMPPSGHLVLAPYPLPASLGEPVATFDSLVDAAAAFYPERSRLRVMDRGRSSLGGVIRARSAGLTRAVRRIGAPVGNQDTARLRQLGDLLLAHPEVRIADGAASVPDDYRDGSMVEIPVDPRLDRIANAQRLYDRARKLERKAIHDARRLASIESQLEDLAAIEAQLVAIHGIDELRGIANRLEAMGLAPKREPFRDAEAPGAEVESGSGPGRGSVTRPPGSPGSRGRDLLESGIVRVRLSDQTEILVGRSAKANDRLTHGVALAHDWWLHADAPGSHVILRNPHRAAEPTATALEAAAAIAAWYSKARDSKLVEVRWTRAGSVRKPRGAPAGLAVLDRYRSIRVSPRAPDDLLARQPDRSR